MFVVVVLLFEKLAYPSSSGRRLTIRIVTTNLRSGQRTGAQQRKEIDRRKQAFEGTRAMEVEDSPQVTESGIQNPRNFFCWNPESSGLESRIHIDMESGIQ